VADYKQDQSPLFLKGLGQVQTSLSAKGQLVAITKVYDLLDHDPLLE
jgi:hypothetical protein